MSSISSASANRSVNLKKKRFKKNKKNLKASHAALKPVPVIPWKTKQKLSLHQNNNVMHFCWGGIQKALFSLARLRNLCSEHWHLLLRVRSPKRVALPTLRVKWPRRKISYLKDAHHRFPFLNPFPAPEDVARRQWRSSSHLPLQCRVMTSCTSSHVFSIPMWSKQLYWIFLVCCNSFWDCFWEELEPAVQIPPEGKGLTRAPLRPQGWKIQSRGQQEREFQSRFHKAENSQAEAMRQRIPKQIQQGREIQSRCHKIKNSQVEATR